MGLQLSSLTFNHDPATSRGSALNIRLNGEVFAQLPEWQGNGRPAFPIAYAMKENWNSEIIVVAEFTGPAGMTAEVRGLETASWGDLGGFGHILGPVPRVEIRLDGRGKSGPVPLSLPAPHLSANGIGAQRVAWQWQWRVQTGDPWQRLEETSHQIYTVLQAPRGPWVQAPFRPDNTQLPWAEVLDFACRWAAFTSSPDRAALAVTRALHAFGGRTLLYNCAQGGPTNYAAPAFDCTAFLERLRGGEGRGPYVNCTDCATAVSTFANALGGDLWQSQMFNPLSPFACNPIRLIGHQFFGAVCGTGFFNYHEVAWEGFCTEFEQIYDASLEVAVPAAPAWPQMPYLPSDIVFGGPFRGSYRDLLVAPLARPICLPQPATRRRRAVY